MEKQVLVKSAVKSNGVRKNFNFTVDSSFGAFQILPVFYKEMLPKGRVRCNDGIFYAQANAMAVPSFAKYRFQFNPFFVPYKYVWPAWEDFYAKNKHYYPATSNSVPTVPSVPQQVPFITMGDLVAIFTNSNYGLMQVTPSGQIDDVVVLNANSTTTGYQFTRKGIAAYKVLTHLGYLLDWIVGSKVQVEILSLLCYGKAYMDYYYPSNYAYVGTDFYTIAQAFVTDMPVVQAGSGTGDNQIYYNAITCILKDCCYIYFNNSHFYDVWDKPTSPNSGSDVNVTISDVTNDAANGPQTVTNYPYDANSPSASGYKPSNSTPFIGGLGTASYVTGVTTSFVVRQLLRLQNFVTRYQLAGSRLIDRWLSYLGVSLPDSHRAIHLKAFEVPLKIGEVVATSDSYNSVQLTNSSVGDKSGMGKALNDGLSFEFVNKENTHGLFMVLCSCNLDNYIVTGIDRNRYHIEALDFYQPMQDVMGPQMVYKSEVYMSTDGSKNDDVKGKFGFSSQYYEHCTDKHIMSGAIVAGSFGSNGLAGWFPRKFFGSSLQSNIVHSQAFMAPSTVDFNSANLPFYDRTFDENFIFTCQWPNVELVDSKRSLKEVFDFMGEEDNETVEISNGGTRI